MSRVLLPFPAQLAFAQAMAPQLGARVGELSWRRFPDGESLVSVDTGLRDADVAVVASLDRPDEIALALNFAAATAREFGARSVGLVAPYLAYLRQDQRFAPGQALSARLFARWLDNDFDWLVTVDPHLHRIHALGELFSVPVHNVAAAPAVAAWIRANVPDALVVGPDAESGQWVQAIAAGAGVPWMVLDKQRHGDRDVSIATPEALPAGRTPVLVDDIASTARTLLAAIAGLAAVGAPPPVCVVTHAVFAGDAYARLQASGAARVVSTDTIAHPTNAIGVAALVAAAAAGMFGADPPGEEDAAAWFDGDAPPL
jgi:ribose-phosphate pyrophosphokinase